MESHEFLGRLHQVVSPRNYLEIGVYKGASLALSHVPTIAVDPAFRIVHEVTVDLDLHRTTSDEFFAGPEPLKHFGGRPVDLAFIDGLHLSEFALRDLINVEALSHPFSVIVLDDMLPRDVEEAARDGHTYFWAGDVYKVADVLRRHRPDLVVVEVDTQKTGTVLVFLPDAANTVLRDAYLTLEAALTTPDPQSVPDDVLTRRTAMDPELLLEAPFWSVLVEERDGRADAEGAARLREAIEASGLRAMAGTAAAGAVGAR